MPRRKEKVGPTVDQDGKTVQMPHQELGTLPGVLKGCGETYNGVKNGQIDHKVAGQMNRALTTAVKVQMTMIDTLVKADAGKKALQAMAAQFCELSPIAIEDGSGEKKEPRRRSQGSELPPTE